MKLGIDLVIVIINFMWRSGHNSIGILRGITFKKGKIIVREVDSHPHLEEPLET